MTNEQLIKELREEIKKQLEIDFGKGKKQKETIKKLIKSNSALPETMKGIRYEGYSD